jgi:hypothetical protein
MYLKYCEKKDIDFLREKYSKEIEYLPLKNDDSTYKNFIIYDFIKNSDGKKGKFVDCGSGPSPLSWLLCDMFEEGHMIDISVKNNFNKSNLYHNIGDFFSYMETHEDETIDYALDGCSIIHFNYDENGNIGLQKAAEILSRKIKKNGYFVMASDVISHKETTYFNQNEFVKVDDIIKTFELNGFKLIGDFNYDSMDKECTIQLEYHGKSVFEITYCSLIFKKN